MLNNNHLCLCIAAQYVSLFLVLVVNSNRFRILHSFTRPSSSRPFLCTLVTSYEGMGGREGKRRREGGGRDEGGLEI